MFSKQDISTDWNL